MASSSTHSTVVIIGAGLSGLASAKEALECGLKPTILEKSNAIGGLWRPKSGAMWDSMHTNLSRHTCQFSDFPWPADTQDFPSQSEVTQYLDAYATTFKIHPHLRLNSEATKIQKAQDQWRIEWINENKETECSNFDYVIVCSGVFSRAFTPDIEGIKSFPGTILHSHEYKTPLPFKNKTVVVIGNAFSGTEVAAEIAQTAEKVINVIRRPLWILPRYLPTTQSDHQIPNDLIFYSRAAQARSEGVDPAILNTRKNNWFKSLCSKQADICPELNVATSSDHPPFVTISDHYLEQIELGKIIVKQGEVQKIEGNQLITSGSDPIEADALIFCTGYRTDLSFFDTDSQNALEFHSDDSLQPLLLHQTVFHPHFPHLAFVGMYRGPYFGTIELQARMACLTFSGQIDYPSDAEMSKGIEAERAIRQMTPRPQFPHGNYVQFSDHLAKHIGALPDLPLLEQENPKLHELLFQGPFTPASFRLSGPGSNPDIALDIIQKINDRKN